MTTKTTTSKNAVGYEMSKRGLLITMLEGMVATANAKKTTLAAELQQYDLVSILKDVNHETMVKAYMARYAARMLVHVKEYSEGAMNDYVAETIVDTTRSLLTSETYRHNSTDGIDNLLGAAEHAAQQRVLAALTNWSKSK
jgi:hypothetical protein